MAQNKSLSTQEVADILHVSKSTIYDLIRRGEINSYKIGRKVRFTQDDVDSYIARSRHEQSVQPVRQVDAHSTLLSPAADALPTLVISGQDVVLDILTNYLHQAGVTAQRCYLSSFEGLLSLYEQRVTAAACHLYDAEEKTFNTPFVKKLMPGVPAALINISYRTQGFYVAAGNPKEIHGWRDLSRRDISILNRRPGSSARILLGRSRHRDRAHLPPDRRAGLHSAAGGALRSRSPKGLSGDGRRRPAAVDSPLLCFSERNQPLHREQLPGYRHDHRGGVTDAAG